MIEVETIGGTKVAFYSGPVMAREGDANDVIAQCFGQDVQVIAIPATSLADDFFWLSSGLAGAILQKFQNYGFRVAVLGDISRFTAESPSLRDFIYESNKRGQTMFLEGRQSLEARLGGRS